MSAPEKKLFLLDAFALIYRSFYALNRPNKDGSTSLVNPQFRNSKGLNTSTMYTFTNSLIAGHFKKKNQAHIAFVLDTPVATVRHEMYEEYKGQRPPMPDDLREALPYIFQIVEAFNIPMLKMDGYEADDLVGTLCHKAESEGFVTYMMTPDKDYAQLVTENIFMYRPGRSGNEVEIWDIPKVQEKFGVQRPEQVIDYLGMMGDKVDNIPGIPGVGDKTARKFIDLYGGMEGLYQNVEDLKGKMKEKVIANEEQARLSRVLATIITDVPIPFEQDKLVVQSVNREAVKDVFRELEFRTLWKRVLGEEADFVKGAAARPAPSANDQMDLFGGDGTAEVTGDKKSIENTDHQYHFVDTPEKVADLLAILQIEKTICFDTETTSVDAIRAELVGVSFAVKAGEAWYVPVTEDKAEVMAVLEPFKAIFADESVTKIGQNIKYDINVLHRYGVEVNGPLFDTMVAHYLMYPDGRHNMDALAEIFLDYSTVSITTLIGKKGKDQKSMRDIPQDKISDYACEDADITLQLKEKFEPMLAKKQVRKLFDDVEMPLVPVLAAMEREGIRLDGDELRSMSVVLAEDLEKVEEGIYEEAGEKFLISSPKQVGQILFEKLKITDKPKKTKTGQYATGEDVLSKLVNDHAIVASILKFRELTKLKNTYVDVLPELINPETGRIHTTYNQVVAATGRLSSDNPNLQNIPIRTERGRQIRKAFVTRDEGHILLAADYSQIELRIIAQISGDEGMMDAFKQGLDIHASTAAKVFGVPLEEVTREMRSKAKAVNFGIAYGQGAFGLAQNLNIGRKEAREIIDNYFEQFPKIRSYMEEIIEKSREKGYCETILGRRRYLRDIDSPNAIARKQAERLAINAPIQGSAADMIKIAMIDVQKMLQTEGFKTKMLLQVHDELVFDVPMDEVESVTKRVCDLMEGAIKMEVPIKVDSGEGTTWLEAH